jgi:hypothetical protein
MERGILKKRELHKCEALKPLDNASFHIKTLLRTNSLLCVVSYARLTRIRYTLKGRRIG